MSKQTPKKFIEFVELSRLVDKDQLAEALSALKASDPAALEDAEQLATRLIEAKLLTRWQCNNLLQGKHKSFFLGPYKLLGLLGTGGMSSVYLAAHTMMHCQRAIKVLPEKRVEDSSYLQRFVQEARAAGQLNHPNVVQTLDICQEGKIHYIVMEYVEGRDLQTLVKEQGSLDYELAADYIRQAADGLAYAHGKNIIHRDVKPANLLLDNRGVVKILDLGLARFIDEKAASLTIDHDENVLGTADYLAPEQASDSHSADHRADIYSLGCTLYYLLTGHPPFPQGTLPQRIYMHQTKAPASVYEDRSDAPAPLIELCSRMMNKSPDGRIQTAREVSTALMAWVAARRQGSSGGSAGSLEPSTRPLPPPRRTGTATLPAQRREKTNSTSDTLVDTGSDTKKKTTRPASASPTTRQSGPRRSGDSSGAMTPAGGLPRAQSLGSSNDMSEDPASALFGVTGYGSSVKSSRQQRDHMKNAPGAFPMWLGLVIFVLGLASIALLIFLNR